ncbi:MAG: hypothetical protein ABJE47_01065 [bacterium]
MNITRTIGALVACLTLSHAAAAQQPNASAAAFGMAGNYSAAASGYDAVAWNPAALGQSAPAFTLNLLSLGGVTGLDPVRLSDINGYAGKLIPASAKESWLQSIGSGTERGRADAGISIVALSIGHLAFQAGVSGTGQANLNQDAAEALLFGNAGRTGTSKSLAFNGSSATGSSFGTGAVSIGIPVAHGDHGETFSMGVTGKYVFGIAMGRAQDNGSTVTANNINVQFPVIYTDSAHLGDAGSGLGVDLGLAWSNTSTTFSAAARNVVNTFAWSTSALRSRVGTFSFDGTTSKGTFDEAPYSSAPQSMRTALEAEKFKPEIAIGLAHHAGSFLVTADASQRIGDGIDIGPKMHVGAGAEFTGIPLLSLRAGAAVITDGYQAAGGIGLHLGPVELGVGVNTRSRNSGQEMGAMVSLISIR